MDKVLSKLFCLDKLAKGSEISTSVMDTSFAHTITLTHEGVQFRHCTEYCSSIAHQIQAAASAHSHVVPGLGSPSIEKASGLIVTDCQLVLVHQLILNWC